MSSGKWNEKPPPEGGRPGGLRSGLCPGKPRDERYKAFPVSAHGDNYAASGTIARAKHAENRAN